MGLGTKSGDTGNYPACGKITRRAEASRYGQSSLAPNRKRFPTLAAGVYDDSKPDSRMERHLPRREAI
jgi:hypothetical protein